MLKSKFKTKKINYIYSKVTVKPKSRRLKVNIKVTISSK